MFIIITVKCISKAFLSSWDQNNRKTYNAIIMDEKVYFSKTHFKRVRKCLMRRLDLCNKWKELGRYLELEETQLDEIEVGYDSKDPVECTIQTVRTWLESHDTKPLLSEFVQALFDMGITSNVILKIFPEKILHCMQKRQVFFYSQLELPSVLFTEKILPLEKFYIDLQMYVKNENGFEIEEGVDIQIEDMFNDVNNTFPSRILIEGNPGYGKTTVIHKLIVDWVKEKSYIFSRFLIILPISLREFNGNLEDFLCDEFLSGKRYQCLEKFTKEEKLKLIKENESKILLLMDGYDELNEESKTLLFPVLNQHWCSDMTVVVTSRPGHLQKPRRSSLSIGTCQQENNKVFWHKKIKIKGIAIKNRKAFLDIYFGVKSNEMLKKLSNGVLRQVRQLLECPLYLLLIASSLESENVDRIKGKTDLYKLALNYLVRRNLVRDCVIQIDQHFDIFGDDELGMKYRKVLLQFGKLSLTMLEKDQLFFKEKEMSMYFEDKSTFIQLGLIVKAHSISSNHQETASYEIVHKTFMEFSAAFYFASENASNILNGIIHLMNTNITPKNNEMLYAFLCGLFPGNIFLKNLEPWKFIYPINYYPMSHFLVELEVDESSLLSLIPSYWAIEENPNIKFGFTHSKNHRKLLTKGRHEDVIQVLKWDAHCSCFLPFQIRFPVLILNVKETSEESYSDVLKNLYKIQDNSSKRQNRIVFCDYLVCRFYRFSPSVLSSISKILPLISAKKVSVTIGVKKDFCSAFKHIQEKIFNGIWKQKEIDNFGISEVDVCSVNNVFVSQLAQLIESGRIANGLGLSFVSSENREVALKASDIQSLVMAVMKSKIQEFALINETNLDISLDIPNYRNFKSLIISGNITFSDSLLVRAVEKLYFPLKLDSADDKHLVKDFISYCKCLEFKCGLNVLKALASQTKNEWYGFECVEKLHLLLSKYSFKASELDVLSNFKKLSFLSVDVVDLYKPEFFEEMTKILFEILSGEIKIDILALKRIDERGVGFVTNLLKRILDYFQRSQWLKEFRIWFTCETNREVRECLSLIKELLEKGTIHKFCLTDLRGIGSLEDSVFSLFDVITFNIARTVATIDTEEIILFKKDVTYEEIVTETICISNKI